MGGNGFLYGGDQFGTQFVGVLLIIVWVGLLSTGIFLPLKMLNMLRLSDAFQDQGADIMEHTPTKAYIQSSLEAKPSPIEPVVAGKDEPVDV